MPEQTLLFSDVVDSTALVQRLGDDAAAALWTRHDAQARALLADCGGREIDRSDGFFLLFDRVAHAAAYAQRYHAANAALGLAARVGIHVGSVRLRRNPDDAVARGAKPVEVEGLAKPLAARVMALARGGQTLLTAAAQHALAGSVPAPVAHGHYRLKGIEAPLEIFELPTEGTPPFPPADGDKAYRVVPDGALWRPVREVRHNLPPERDAFVGRAAELAALARTLQDGARLVTVLGVGGTGKTRLAQRMALAWLGEWPGGAWFCDLSEARRLEGICFAVAQALGVSLGKDDPVEQLGHVIAGRGRCLVILDNFEQVAALADACLGRWLDRAGEARFVVTSRERLHLPGELAFPIEPLPVANDAVELFLQRARAQVPGFAPSAAGLPDVAEVVRLLDGLPLAIELAAARVSVLSPAQIVRRLEDRFALLAGARGASSRQATLRAAIDWSWALLAPWEQAALAACAVFEGGFTLAAAEAVLDLGAWREAPPVLDVVQALVDKSLLRVLGPRGAHRLDIDEPWFGMYLSIHEYAAAQLRAAGQEPAAQQRHGRHFAQPGQDEALEALSLHGGIARRQALALELDNLVAACRRALGRGDGEVAALCGRAAWEAFELSGPYSAGYELARQVLASDALPPPLRARMLETAGRAAGRMGQADVARGHFEQALRVALDLGDEPLELAARAGLARLLHEGGRVEEGAAAFAELVTRLRAAGNRRLLGAVLGNLGILRHEQAHMDEATDLYKGAIEIHREVGDRRCEGNGLANLGILLTQRGRYDEAQQLTQEAAGIQREIGNLLGEANAVHNLGLMADDRGRYDEGGELLDLALRKYRDAGSRRGEAQALGNRGLVCFHQGRFAEARRHYEAAMAIHRETGNRRFEAITLGQIGALAGSEGRTDEALAELAAAAALFGQIDDPRFLALTRRQQAEVLIAIGRSDEAQALLDSALDVLTAVGDTRERAIVLAVRGLLAASRGDLDGARAACAEAEAEAEGNAVGPQSELGRAIEVLRARLGGR